MTAQGTFPDLTPSLLTRFASEFLINQPLSKGQLHTKAPGLLITQKVTDIVWSKDASDNVTGRGKRTDFCTLCSSQHEQSEPIALGFGFFFFLADQFASI